MSTVQRPRINQVGCLETDRRSYCLVLILHYVTHPSMRVSLLYASLNFTWYLFVVVTVAVLALLVVPVPVLEVLVVLAVLVVIIGLYHGGLMQNNVCSWVSTQTQTRPLDLDLDLDLLVVVVVVVLVLVLVVGVVVVGIYGRGTRARTSHKRIIVQGSGTVQGTRPRRSTLLTRSWLASRVTHTYLTNTTYLSIYLIYLSMYLAHGLLTHSLHPPLQPNHPNNNQQTITGVDQMLQLRFQGRGIGYFETLMPAPTPVPSPSTHNNPTRSSTPTSTHPPTEQTHSTKTDPILSATTEPANSAKPEPALSATPPSPGSHASADPPAWMSPAVVFEVGQVVRHKRYGYRCVINGWDQRPLQVH